MMLVVEGVTSLKFRHTFPGQAKYCYSFSRLCDKKVICKSTSAYPGGGKLVLCDAMLQENSKISISHKNIFVCCYKI